MRGRVKQPLGLGNPFRMADIAPAAEMHDAKGGARRNHRVPGLVQRKGGIGDVGQTRRCSGLYPTFDGRFHYVMELSGGQIRDFDDAGYEGEVLRCRMAYIAVAGYEHRDAGRRRIPEGQVWFALMPDANFAPVVRISTPMSAGGATIRLASYRRVRVSIDDLP